MNNRVPPNSPSTPNLFGSGLYRPVTPSASPAPGGWLDQSVPFTPKSNMTSLETGNHQRCVPQVAATTPRTGFSPWISSHIVPHTPIKEETILQESSQETKSNAEIEDGVVPNMEMTTSSSPDASSQSSTSLPPPQRHGSEETKVPIKRCKRYLV